MPVKLLTEQHLEFLSLKGGCTGSSESTHVMLSRYAWVKVIKIVIIDNFKFSRPIFLKLNDIE